MRIRGLNRNMRRSDSAQLSLTARVIAAIRRAGGTVLGAGAATPVLGPELCSDGSFNIGVADWASASGVHTWTGSALRRATGQGDGGSYRDFVVVPNQEYLVYTAMYNLVGTGNARVFAYGGGGFTGLAGTLTASGYMWVRPTSANLRLYLYTDNTRGADFDDVSIKLFSGYTYGNPPVRNFFDSAGTDILDSVTQVDQPVGLTLDGVGTVGADIVIGGDFSSPTGWTAGTGWSIAGGAAVAVAGTASELYRTLDSYATVDKTYLITFTVSNCTAGYVQNRFGGTLYTQRTSNGEFTEIIKAPSTKHSLNKSSAFNGSVDNLVIQELTGNHATQPTIGSKPTLRRGIPNWLTQSDVSQWSFVNASGAATRVGNQVTFGASAVDRVLRSGNVTTAIGQTLTVAAKLSGTGSIRAIFLEGNGGTTTAVGNIELTATPTYYVFPVTSTTAGASGGMGIYNNAAGTAGASFTVHEAGVLNGTVTAQQILAAGGIPLTTTAPASSALGNYWWQFTPDAPGDFLQTSITTGNEGWVCAGVTPANTTTAMSVINAGEGAASIPGIWLFSNGAGVWQASTANGTTRSQANRAMAGAVPQVVSMGWDASSVFVGVNGAETSAARTGTCASGANVLRIGMYQGSSIPFNGGMSVTVICPTPPPPAERALIERWVASRQGQTL